MKKYILISLIFISTLGYSIPGFDDTAPAADPLSGVPMEEGIIPFLIMGGILAYKFMKKK